MTLETTELPELPVLDPSVVDDDQELAEAVDAVVRLDSVAGERATLIAEYTACLRCAAEPDVWKLILEIDGRARERWADLAVVLVRYGFEQGRRYPAPPLESAP